MHPTISRPPAAPTVQPAIAELLRTCVHPPVLHLRIEHVSRKTIKNAEDNENHQHAGYFTKLFLGDGDLLIQGLLHRKLSNLPEIEDLKRGDCLEIREFVVRKARRSSGQGHVVYLGIENCYVTKLGREPCATEATTDAGEVAAAEESKIAGHGFGNNDAGFKVDDMAGGFFRDHSQVELRIDRRSNREAQVHPTSTTHRNYPEKPFVVGAEPDEASVASNNFILIGPPSVSKNPQSRKVPDSHPMLEKRKGAPSSHNGSSDDSDDPFETVRVNLGTANKRRRILHELSQNIQSPTSRPPTSRGSNTDNEVARTSKYNSLSHASLVRFDTSREQKHSVTENLLTDQYFTKELAAVEVPSAYRHGFHHHRSTTDPYNVQRTSPSNPSVHLVCPDPLVSSPIPSIFPKSQSFAWGPFHSLSSLYSPSLPSKSYVFTTLVIPTYIASHLISRPNSTFPAKRHLRVIDPSLAAKLKLEKSNMTGKGITVAVYRDALDFKPTVGRVALMRGVVMQRLHGAMKKANSATGRNEGEVILNVYPTKSRIQKQSQGHHTNPAQGSGQVHAQIVGERQYQCISNQPGHSEATLRPEQNDTPLNGSGVMTSEDVTDTQWFIDDHALLRRHGYAVDAVQQWWDNKTCPK